MAHHLHAAMTVACYQYNAKGERVRKYRDGSSASGQEYAYDESGKLLRQKRALFEQEIIWLDDMPIGVNQNGTWYGILSDHLNTPRQAFDIAKQQIKWRWDAADNAFGEKAAISSGLTLDLRFPGQIYDAESATHYNYFRTYGPDTGRYNESDAIGLRGGISTYGYGGSNPLMYSDPLGLTYGDGVLEMEDVFFGPTYWMRQQMGLNTSFSQSTVDVGAGFGDTISFGATDMARNWMGTNSVINKCSSGYSAGEWAGIAYGFGAGGVAGLRAAGKKAFGKEFSHWIPNRMGGPRSLWNGNYVTTATHALSDPYRYRFMARAWKALNPMPNKLIQQLTRIPNIYKGAAAGGAAAGASSSMNGCECSK